MLRDGVSVEPLHNGLNIMGNAIAMSVFVFMNLTPARPKFVTGNKSISTSPVECLRWLRRIQPLDDKCRYNSSIVNAGVLLTSCETWYGESFSRADFKTHDFDALKTIGDHLLLNNLQHALTKTHLVHR
jgi:hypothetical protein